MARLPNGSVGRVTRDKLKGVRGGGDRLTDLLLMLSLQVHHQK